MSFERKQPKKETTLARLTRQAKALERLVNNHNKAVTKEAERLHGAITRAHEASRSAGELQNNLEALQEEVEDLALSSEED